MRVTPATHRKVKLESSSGGHSHGINSAGTIVLEPVAMRAIGDGGGVRCAMPSPFARKVRIALAEKSIEFELITEVPWESTTMTPRYNPLEKPPILILEDGSSV